MSEKKPHQFKTTKGAAYRLSMHLALPGWFSGTVQAYRGGSLAEELQLGLSSPERELVRGETETNEEFQRRAHGVGKAIKAWDKEPFERDLTDAERDVARACVKKFAADGKLELDPNGVALIKALGLDVEG